MKINPAEIRTLIHIVTRRTGPPLHDEDLEQDVAVRALEAIHRLKQIAYPKALLMKIVRDTVRDHWRRRRSSEELAGIEERYISHVPAFESNLDHERRLELLRCALDRLPAAKRKLLELFYISDHSIAEIAVLQDRSISAVKMELVRSRQSLARIFRQLADKKLQISRVPRTSQR
jgi:RNA polymerase sigma-70 factor (ECF subfamily)